MTLSQAKKIVERLAREHRSRMLGDPPYLVVQLPDGTLEPNPDDWPPEAYDPNQPILILDGRSTE